MGSCVPGTSGFRAAEGHSRTYNLVFAHEIPFPMSTVIPLRQVGDTAPFARPKHIYMLHFDIVRGCQLQCVGCPTPEIESKIHRISVDDWAQSLANIDVEKVNMLRLYRSGEPLLHKQLAQIVEQIPRQRWKASVVEINSWRCSASKS